MKLLKNLLFYNSWSHCVSPEVGCDIFGMRERAVENWLHNQVGSAWDALKADPSRAVTAEQVRVRLAAERAKTRN